MNSVNTVPVLFPDFTPPDGSFLDDYSTTLDISNLAIHGITEARIQSALAWIQTLGSVRLPRTLDNDVLRHLAKELDAGVSQCITLEPSVLKNNTRIGTVAIAVDHTNAEALCSAFVLEMILRPLTMHDTTIMPGVLKEKDVLPAFTTACLFLFVNGTLANRGFLRKLLQAGQLRVQAMPILGDERFCLPTKDAMHRCPVIGAMDGAQMIVQTVSDLFREIAVVFTPQHSSEVILKVGAMVIADRVLGRTRKSLVRLASKDDPQEAGRAGKLTSPSPCVLGAQAEADGRSLLPGASDVDLVAPDDTPAMMMVRAQQ
jgi:hypothetical protein